MIRSRDLPQWGQLVEQEQAPARTRPREDQRGKLVAVLIYYPAEAQAREGDAAAADRTAARALGSIRAVQSSSCAHLELGAGSRCAGSSAGPKRSIDT